MRVAAFFAILFSSNFLWAAQPIFSAEEGARNSTITIQNAQRLAKDYFVLEGPWDCFEGELISPVKFYYDEIPSGAKNSIASAHTLVSLPHKFSEGVHFATYHCRVKGLVPEMQYAMTIYGRVFSCCRIWCNKELAGGAGVLNRDKHIARAAQTSAIIELPADSNGTIDIVIQVANFELEKGGIVKKLAFTEKSNLEKQYLKMIFFSTMIIAFFSILITYNLILMLMNRKPLLHLLFVVVSGFFLLSVATSGVSIFNLIFPNVPFWIEFRLPILLFSSGICTYIIIINISRKIPSYLGIAFFLASALIVMTIASVQIKIFEREKNIFAVLPILVLESLTLLSFRISIKKNLKAGTIFSMNAILYNFEALVNTGILFVFFYDFIIAPKSVALIYSCLAFKTGILMFGISQCITSAFRRYLTNYRIKQYSQRYQMNNNLIAKFIPRQILKFMNADDITKIVPGGCNIFDAMIVYAEIRHFKQLANCFEEKQLFEMISTYYKNIAPLIRDYGGHIAKYMQHGCLIVFTERNDTPIRCAMEMQKKMIEIRRELRKSHNTDISIGIAIHTGKVAYGVLGSERKFTSIAFSQEVQNAIKIGMQASKMDAKIFISEDAMTYCRTYSDCIFEGHFISVGGERILIYSAIPFKEFKTDFIDNLELAEDDSKVGELEEV